MYHPKRDSDTNLNLPRPQASLLVIWRCVRGCGICTLRVLHPSHDAPRSLFVGAITAPGDKAESERCTSVDYNLRLVQHWINDTGNAKFSITNSEYSLAKRSSTLVQFKPEFFFQLLS